ncbi:phosphotriesterase family protein [Ornithinimicrobium panacihumi]|uniref:phosphotriesterase family protein n=1 Tax=Ornithinimicrobium panacihumi TaxID=2008449 RepID=UPI003F8C009D
MTTADLASAQPEAQVVTVRGPIPVQDMGVTLTHEHVLNDVTSWAHTTSARGWDPQAYAKHPVSEDILWDLRHDPFGNLDNCRLDDIGLAVAEVERYRSLGGRTIIDTTSMNSGRRLRDLRTVSERSGVHIVAGTGYYLAPSHPPQMRHLDAHAIAEQILEDLQEGHGGARPGIIGEIGVGAEFPEPERRSLAGAFLAQREVGLPVQVHLPAWFKRGHEVLDVAEAHGVPPERVVLCHMGPSGADLAYQEELLRRGAWVQYDMIGMEVFYADQGVQCPSDEENAAWLTRLVERGWTDQLLISQDIFLKSLLRAHGGPGYGHILQYFVPRLHRHGLTPQVTDRLLVHNPQALFMGRST